MQTGLELHRRVNTELQSLPTLDVDNVQKAFNFIQKNADNLSHYLNDKVYKFTGEDLPNTYMIEAVPSPYQVLFEMKHDGHILIQDIIHRDWFTRFKKDDK